MNAVFVDSSVLVYAFGSSAEKRVVGLSFIRRCRESRTRIHISVEAVQEFVFHRMRLSTRRLAFEQAAEVRAMAVVHTFDDAVLDEALRLMSVSDVRGRDAIHAATALLAGFTTIVSADHDFDDVPGLARADPADWRP